MAVGTETMQVFEPATEQVLTELPRAGVEEADEAISRANAAFPGWKDVAPGDRAKLLRRLARALEGKVEELAQLEARNVGKPISDARGEVGSVVDVFDYYAGAPERLLGSQIPVSGGVDVTFREPLGVVGLITPWNFPLPIASWKVGPALAAGNTIVLKPAELTPLTAIELGKLALEAGIPEGVVNVVAGPGSVCGQRLVEHPDVAKIAFTGSTEVGRQIMAGCAEQVKHVTLELGGKSANIVFADADVAAAAAAAPGAVFDNAGQDCCARSRILVERSVYDEFLGRLETAISEWRVLDPADESSQMGPMVSAGQRDSVQRYVDAATIAFQGTTPGGDGYWLPAMVTEAKDVAEPVWREEVFGPLVAVMAFDDEDEAVALANDSDYGLSGSIYTRDLGRALRVSRGVQTGNLSVNSHASVRYWTPFGGYKMSGLGRELGPDAPYAFTEEKNVFIAH